MGEAFDKASTQRSAAHHRRERRSPHPKRAGRRRAHSLSRPTHIGSIEVISTLYCKPCSWPLVQDAILFALDWTAREVASLVCGDRNSYQGPLSRSQLARRARRPGARLSMTTVQLPLPATRIVCLSSRHLLRMSPSRRSIRTCKRIRRDAHRFKDCLAHCPPSRQPRLHEALRTGIGFSFGVGNAHPALDVRLSGIIKLHSCNPKEIMLDSREIFTKRPSCTNMAQSAPDVTGNESFPLGSCCLGRNSLLAPLT